MELSFVYNGCTVKIFDILSENMQIPTKNCKIKDDCFELHYIDSGKGFIELERHKHDVRRETLLLLGPNTSYRIVPNATQNLHELRICISANVPANANKMLGQFVCSSFWIGRGTKDIEELFRRIIMERELADLWSEDIICGRIIELLSKIVRLCTNDSLNKNANNIDLNEGREWILDELFANKIVEGSLDDFADSLGVCSRQAERIIFDAYGSGFKKLRFEARMARAVALLEEGECTVSKCASQCGYASTTSFNKAFKSKFNMTPKEYQLNAKKVVSFD